jgi:nonsense-mediated mRNA decay protein 3
MALRRNKEIRKHVLRIDSCRNGLDFYFLAVPHAQTFASFLSKLAPMRLKASQKMVSEDNHSNTANVRHTVICDMVPLCRDDLILVHKISRGLLSGRLALVTKVSSQIHLVDASPKRTELDMTSLHPDGYYKAGGEKAYPICQSAQRMIKFVVLDVELCDTSSSNSSHQNNNDVSHPLYQGPASGVEKYALADVEVARESDFGTNDMTYHCVSHLGHLLQPGDVVLGYDLASTSATISTSSSAGVVDMEDVVNHNFVMPDVVLVKKIPSKQLDTDGNVDNYEKPLVGGGTKKRASKRKLRRINKKDKKQRELEESAVRMGFVEDNAEEQNFDDEQENGEFQEELENDPELAAELDDVERELATLQVDDDDDAVLVEGEEGKEGEENVAADDDEEPKSDPVDDSPLKELS